MSSIALSLLAILSMAGPAPLAGHAPALERRPFQDPVRIEATITPATIAAGEVATLELHLVTGGDQADLITLPDLPPELEILRTSDFTQLHFALPGGRSRTLRREFMLRATKPGTYRIPPITARVRGKEYQTATLTLTVADDIGAGAGNRGGVPGGAGPAARGPTSAPRGALTFPGTTTGSLPGSLARGPRDEVLLNARLSTDTAYVSQQVTLRARTWVAEEAQFRLRRAPEYHPPNASGFWTHDLPGPLQAGRQSLDDQLYRVQEFQRAYFPLTPGSYMLPPARLVYEVRRGFLTGSATEELTTDSLRLVVLPFPEEGRPADFNGAVGELTISARLEPSAVPVGEAAALIVVVEGTGNIKALPPPRLPAMAGVELHPPAEDAEVNVRQGRIGGRKRFTWILVPREHGTLEVPALEYPYFDPTLREYRVARADPLALTVEPGSGPLAAPEAPRELRGIRLHPGGDSPLAWVRRPLTGLALLAAPLLALAPLLLRRRPRSRRGDDTLPTPRARRRQRRAALEELRRSARTSDDTCAELAARIRTEIALRLGEQPPARGAAETLAAALEAQDVPEATAGALARLLSRAESARFEPKPPGPELRREMVEEAARLFAALDRGAPGRERSRRATRHASVGVVLLATLPLATPSQTGTTTFQRAVKAYQAGEFTAAADGFAEFLGISPLDQAAWYNLGNAEFQAGRRGPALRAWLHALRLTPRDPALRHNLTLAGIDPELTQSATRGIPLSEEEFLLLAGIVWLIGAGFLCAYTITRRRPAAVVGVSALGVALLAVAIYHAPRAAPDTALALPDELPIRVAPEPRAQPLDLVTAGTPLRIHQRRGTWLRVTTAAGAEGWVEADLVGAF